LVPQAAKNAMRLKVMMVFRMGSPERCLIVLDFYGQPFWV
jgi:hypothetical protein